MNARIRLLTLAGLLTFVSLPALAQNFEVGGHIGGQINGGVDFSTSLFRRLEVENSMNYGVTAGVLLGDLYGVEFQWNHTQADTVAEPVGGGSNIRVFSMNQNQYMGQFVIHFADRETPLRPFVFFGAGASDLSPDREGVEGVTRFSGTLGAGAKYNFHKNVGVRAQVKWSPTYLTTTDEGYWCDPFWGGCWVVGDDRYLHEFDFSGGITFRF